MTAGERFTIPAPSVAEPGVLLIRRIHMRDNRTCVYCGATGRPLEVDHVRARAHFAATALPSKVNSPRNLVTACDACNGAKGPQNLDGFAAMLRGRGVRSKSVVAMKRRVRAAVRRQLPMTLVR